VKPRASASLLTGDLGLDEASAAQQSKLNLVAAATRDRRKEKENMADFIAKKRDMFLIQMSLDTKRAEIQKLEEKTQMKDDALKKSEMMLADDAMRFDAFLKDNDRKAHDALKRADQESKEKAEKKAELKKLNQEISRITSEMAKSEDSLQHCELHKSFLDSVTPQEFKDQQALLLDATLQERGQTREDLTPEELDELLGQQRMYFKDPEQLLNIFAHLEERNLFLIQNVQETEEALEELKQKFEEGKSEMDEKTEALETNILDLQQKMQAEKVTKNSLVKRAQVSGSSGHQKELLDGLASKVAAVYEDCGFEEGQSDPLDMLRDLERWLEYLLHEINKYNSDDTTRGRVQEEEKAIKDSRRREWREAVKIEVQKQADERQAKSTARAKAEIIRRTGKQVMFRSPPFVKKVKQEKKKEINPEAEELLRYLT
jgi:hypothetical protein